MLCSGANVWAWVGIDQLEVVEDIVQTNHLDRSVGIAEKKRNSCSLIGVYLVRQSQLLL